MKLKHVLLGDKRIRRRFAWLPVRLSKPVRTSVWLEWYMVEERYGIGSFGLLGWNVLSAWQGDA
jgi:hypothetical protein